jgi:hypothetical protein
VEKKICKMCVFEVMLYIKIKIFRPNYNNAINKLIQMSNAKKWVHRKKLSGIEQKGNMRLEKGL